MSSIPKATRSSINDTVVSPNNSESYPIIERSVINATKFEDLSSETLITRSSLNNVTVTAKTDCKGNSSNELSRCVLTGCIITGACISRSELSGTEVTGTKHMERMTAQNTKVVNPGCIERSQFEDSCISGGSDVHRSSVNRSAVADLSRVTRSQVDEVTMNKSYASRSVLKKCEVEQCNISGSNFTGKMLKYGIWENGKLVGRTCDGYEVVIEDIREGKGRLEDIMGSGTSGSKGAATLHPGNTNIDTNNSNGGPSGSERRSESPLANGPDEQDQPPPSYESHFF